MIRKSKLTEREIVELYLADVRINEIAKRACVSRQSINATLKRCNVHNPTKGTLYKNCLFCDDLFTTFRCQNSKYCSIACYNADKDGYGIYGQRGRTEELELQHDLSLRMSRHDARRSVVVKAGEVVHHEDGDPFNNDPDNLIVFKSQAEHMRYHHAKRRAKHE